MGTERVSSLVLSFDGEAGSIDSVIAGIKSRITSAVKELEYEEFMKVISPWEREHLLLHV